MELNLNLIAAANDADIVHDGAGTAHLQAVIDVLTERLDATEDPDAARAGIAADPGYGPDHDDLADFVWEVADDATARLAYHADIVDAYAGVCGWREEADIADDGLFLPEQTIEQRMLVVLFRVAERFCWSLIVTAQAQVAA